MALKPWTRDVHIYWSRARSRLCALQPSRRTCLPFVTSLSKVAEDQETRSCREGLPWRRYTWLRLALFSQAVSKISFLSDSHVAATTTRLLSFLPLNRDSFLVTQYAFLLRDFDKTVVFGILQDLAGHVIRTTN